MRLGQEAERSSPDTEELLDCIQGYGLEECRRIYGDTEELRKIAECMEKCVCEETFEDGELLYRPEGAREEYDDWCKKNCLCVDY